MDSSRGHQEAQIYFIDQIFALDYVVVKHIEEHRKLTWTKTALIHIYIYNLSHSVDLTTIESQPVKAIREVGVIVKVLKSTFFKPWPAGNQTLKIYKANKHIPVLDIAKNKSVLISGIAEIRP